MKRLAITLAALALLTAPALADDVCEVDDGSGGKVACSDEEQRNANTHNAAQAQKKADKAETDAATAQQKADKAETDAATAQQKADKAEGDAANAQQKADKAEGDAANAQQTADDNSTTIGDWNAVTRLNSETNPERFVTETDTTDPEHPVVTVRTKTMTETIDGNTAGVATNAAGVATNAAGILDNTATIGRNAAASVARDNALGRRIDENTQGIKDAIALSVAIPDSYLSPGKNFALALGGGFTDGSEAFGGIGTVRIGQDLTAYGGGSALFDGGTWAAKAGVRMEW